LKWLSDEQKNELKRMKADGKTRAEMQDRVLGWLDHASGDVKAAGTEQLMSACKEFMRDALGEEKSSELRAMKDAGKDKAEIAKRVDELIAEISDEKKKAMVSTYAKGCKKVFGVPIGVRHRRDPYSNITLIELCKRASSKRNAAMSKALRKECRILVEESAGKAKLKELKVLKKNGLTVLIQYVLGI
uniref:NPA domain-containing protein n=1 Tax=Toxocara canis TaxID=6265 RepID=A0A183TVZ2_TOXCA